MAKYYQDKTSPRLIILEGFWQMGKSLLIKELAKKFDYEVIKEPNHLFLRFISNPHAWYHKQHFLRHKKASIMLTRNRRVIMERSIISNAAFDYARSGSVSKKYLNILRSMPQLNHSIIFFLYGRYDFVKSAAKNLKDASVRELLEKDTIFYKRYLAFYKKILNKIVDNKIFCVNVAQKVRYIAKNKFIKIFNNSLLEIEKRTKEEFCVSAVVVFKDKYLLLYDENWHHYVLPQGHINPKESPLDAIFREIKEETGYYNLQLLGKLQNYRYSYIRGGHIVVKNIQPYIFRLTKLKRIKKVLNSKEKYINHFYKYRKSCSNLRWNVDKMLIGQAKEILKRRAPK